MPNEQPSQAPGDGEPGMDPVHPVSGTGGGGPGGAEAGISGILLLVFYLILFTLFVIYSMVKIWPQMTPSREPAPGAANPAATASPSSTPTPVTGSTPTPTTANSTPTRTPNPTPSASATPSPLAQPSPVSILGLQFEMWDEQRLLLLVILGGALGTLVHSLRSVYWYIGNRNLVKSWMAMYFMMPFAGAALALVFYLVVRGGFFSPQSSFQQTSPFGFAAFSALIGMFSSQAVLKLKEVAEVMLSKPLGGANPQPQGLVNPTTTVPPPPIQPPPGGNPPVKP